MTKMAESAVRMANQIARNLEVGGREAAIAATATHITDFWDPQLKAAAFKLAFGNDTGLSDIAQAAVLRLASQSGQAVPASELGETSYPKAD